MPECVATYQRLELVLLSQVGVVSCLGGSCSGRTLAVDCCVETLSWYDRGWGSVDQGFDLVILFLDGLLQRHFFWFHPMVCLVVST
jgi:hypothetical protein